MNSSLLRLRPLALAVAALVAAGGLSANSSYANSPVYVDDSGHLNPGSVSHVVSNVSGTARYIVRFKEQPVAVHFAAAQSSVGSTSSTGVFVTGKNGRAHLDTANSTVKAYAAQLSTFQQQHLSDIRTAIGRNPMLGNKAPFHMVHALNAVVVELTSAEVNKVLKVAGVAAVNRDIPHALATDIGPGFIGASSVWWGTPAGQDTIFAGGFDSQIGFRGDGIVIGDIDTGYNSMSPSFQPTDSSGYTVQNPLGSGNFLPMSQCNLGAGATGISLAGCNDKVIGAYDELDLTNSDPNFSGTYSVEDTQGHGSHTASTAGGDGRSATLAGYTAPISGVAPHANLVIYYVCSPDPAIQCSTAATSAAADQAIQDGVVDALNYSISGGTDPWNDPTSLAFLSAADAGIFIAAAAGNTGTSVPLQVPGTANHLEPWVATAAAGTHTGGAIAPDLSITGPGTPPANVQNIPLTEGVTDTPPTATVLASMDLSPTFHNSDTSGSDACAAFSAGQFTGAIALVSRGTCTFSTKVGNAVTAGAIAVIISDNRPEAPLTASLVPTATVPVYTVTQAQGTALQGFLAGNSSTAPAAIPFPPIRQPTQPDVLAGFSLLGPANIDVIKPDIQGPGVNILASVANDGTVNGPNLVALFSGTSMATPHTTGSGALMLGLHPDWTPAEAKSALMMTAKEAGLTKANGITPSDFFDRGSGRLQDFPASHVGLVLNETGLNYANADPAFGGDPGTLNIASMQSASCFTGSGATTTSTCSFTRKFRSTQDHTVTYTVGSSTDGMITVTPDHASFQIVAHQSQPLNVTVDSTATNADGVFHFAELTLTPSDTTLPVLHLPIAVKVPPPAIAAAPSPLAISIPNIATTGNATLTVTNTGGGTLNVTSTNDKTTASTKYVAIDQTSEGNNGFYSTFFTDQGPPTGSYASDDFVIAVGGANLTQIVTPGFSTGTALTALAGHGVHFRLFGDAPGFPNGDPEGITSPTLPVYSFDTTIGSTGLSVAGNTISLNLVAAGAPATNLTAGRYWLVVDVDMAFGTDGGWAQFVSNQSNGDGAQEFGPVFGETQWSPIAGQGGPQSAFAMHIEEQVPCGAAWLSTSPATLAVGAQQSAPVTVSADSTMFPFPGPGTATAFLCLDSNDANTPVLAVPVSATQH
jgi:Subtilase family/PA domain